MRERKWKTWLLFLLLPHENEDRFHMRERDNCFFLCCTSTWDKGLLSTMTKRWIVFPSSSSLLATWCDIGFVIPYEKGRWIASMWMKREMVHYFIFFVPPWERKRDGLLLLLLLLLLPHEDKDCKFCMKNMIISFCFHMRPRICLPHKAWNTRS